MHKLLLYTLPLILFCLSSYAQPNPINRRAMAIAGLATTPPNKFDLAFTGLVVSNRWLSATLDPTNFVSDWIDVTNSFHWTQTNSTYRPTNSAIGVRFNKNGSGHEKFLDATNILKDGDLLTWICYRVDSDNISGWNGLFKEIGGNSRGIELQPTAGPSQSLAVMSFSGGKQSLDVYQDALLDANGGFPKIYTNGVDASSSGVTWFTFISNTAQVGVDDGNDYLGGYIAEFIIFTNKAPFAPGFVNTAVSNMHYYRTNVYGGSP